MIDLMNFSTMLKTFRERAGYTKARLAEKIGVTSQYLISIEKNNRTAPTIEKCNALAIALGISESERKEFISAAIKERAKGETIDWLNSQEVKLVPVISWVHANQFSTIEDPFLPGSADEYVPSTAKGPHVFSLIVKNDCMFNPSAKISFPEGIRIVVDPDQKDLHHEKFYVIRDAKAQEATFKQYLRKGKKTILHPLNQKYEDIELDHDERYEVVGRVIGAYIKT